MARAETTDHLQAFRFHVTAEAEADASPFIKFSGTSPDAPDGEAGFQSVTIPEVSLEVAEYREGTYKYTRKYPGVPTYSDATLMRGVCMKDTVFWDWLDRAVSGGAYRTDITIWHYNREEVGPANAPLADAERSYFCHDCIPLRAKPSADFDSTSSEVSLQEVDFATEWVEVKLPGDTT